MQEAKGWNAQAKKENRKISVLNGPVFRSNGRKYRGVVIPREFWKVIVFERDSGDPGAAAFILSQSDQITNMPKEEFEPGEFSVFPGSGGATRAEDEARLR